MCVDGRAYYPVGGSYYRRRGLIVCFTLRRTRVARSGASGEATLSFESACIPLPILPRDRMLVVRDGRVYVSTYDF